MTSNPEKVVFEKFYVHEIAAVDLSKMYFLKNAMKTCKPSNRDLNRDWKNYPSIKDYSWYLLCGNLPILECSPGMEQSRICFQMLNTAPVPYHGAKSAQ